MVSFGALIREQRENLGFSLAEIAEMAGFSSDRLGALESGQSPTTWEVSTLADALALDAGALWRGDIGKSPARSTARFRSAIGVSQIRPHDVRLLSKSAEVGRIVGYLREQLGDAVSPVVNARRVSSIESYPDPWEQGYRLAAKARTLLIPDKRPIISLEGELEKLGVVVLRVRLDRSILAASLYEPGAAPMILLNDAVSRVQSALSRRAVLAHELCHLLYDGGEHDLLTLVSRYDSHESFEQRANGFAPGFLVPGGWLSLDRESVDLRDFVFTLAREWGLSFEGAAWHAKNARRITNQECDELLRSAQVTPEIVPDGQFEPPMIDRDPAVLGLDCLPSMLATGLVTDIVLRAFEAEIISAARAREILTAR